MRVSHTRAAILLAGILIFLASARPASAQNNSNLQLSCNSLQFSVAASTRPTGISPRNQPGTITCITNFTETALKYVNDAREDRRFATARLVWTRANSNAGFLSATISNAVISSIEVTEESGLPVEEITLSFERVDFQFEGSKDHTLLDAGPMR